MSKILPPVFLCILFAGLVTACNPNAGQRTEAPINPDTVKHHVISIAEAIEMTTSFRAAIDSMARKQPHFRDSLDFGHAEEFPADVFRKLLQQSDSTGPAVGIRIYYGRDPDGRIRQILVPVDSAGHDIINHMVDIEARAGQPRVESLKVSNGQAVENGQRCPPVCDSLGGLN